MLAFSWGTAVATATEEAPAETQPSHIEVMVRVLLSNATELSLRQANAASLLDDPTAHAALVDILEKPNNIAAKTIICRVIATREPAFPVVGASPAAPQVFIDPLFGLLSSPDADLSASAARALTRFRDGVAARLAGIVADGDAPTAQRSAAIEALALMPGKPPLLALAAVLDDGEGQIANRARQVVAERLGITGSLDRASFEIRYLPVLEEMGEETFLRWQIALERRALERVRAAQARAEEQTAYWRRRSFDALAAEFDRRSGEQRLAFLAEQINLDGGEATRLWALERIAAWCRAGVSGNNGVHGAIVEFILPYVRDASCPAAHRQAAGVVTLLGNHGRPAATALAGQLAAETDPGAQAAMLEALGNLQYAEGATTYLKLLGSDQGDVVMQAARALGRVVESASLDDALMQQIISGLGEAYTQANDAATRAAVRRDLIIAMQKVAGQDAYRAAAEAKFAPLLSEALSAEEGTVRRAAVSALTSLRRREFLPVIEQRNLFDDPDTRVRYAVIEAIDQYGGNEHIPLLRSRLQRESDGELARAALLAARNILSRGGIDQAHGLVVSLANSEGHLATLHRDALRILLAKIADQRAAGVEISTTIERDAYAQNAAINERDGDFTGALTWYMRLLALPLPPEQAASHRQKVVELALGNLDNDELVGAVAQVLPRWLAEPVNGNGNLAALLRQAYSGLNLDEPGQLRRGVRLATRLGRPSVSGPDSGDGDFWGRARADLARRVVARLQEQVADEAQNVDAQLAAALPLLYERLTGFAPEGAVADQQAALSRFREILQPPAPEPVEAQAASEAADGDSEAPDEAELEAPQAADDEAAGSKEAGDEAAEGAAES